MKTCKTCKHWFPDRISAEGKERRLKFCLSPMIKYGYEFDDSDIAENGAIVENDEGWGMLTGPEFGCVNHEEKINLNEE